MPCNSFSRNQETVIITYIHNNCVPKACYTQIFSFRNRYCLQLSLMQPQEDCGLPSTRLGGRVEDVYTSLTCCPFYTWSASSTYDRSVFRCPPESWIVTFEAEIVPHYTRTPRFLHERRTTRHTRTWKFAFTLYFYITSNGAVARVIMIGHFNMIVLHFAFAIFNPIGNDVSSQHEHRAITSSGNRSSSVDTEKQGQYSAEMCECQLFK